MGFCSSAQKKKLLLLLLLRRQWIKSKQRRSEAGCSKDHSDISAAKTVQDEKNDELEISVLSLRREKLLLEIEKLTEERERIAAEKRNVSLRREMLHCRGVYKCAKCKAPSKSVILVSKPVTSAHASASIKTEIITEQEDDNSEGIDNQLNNENSGMDEEVPPLKRRRSSIK